MEKQLSTDSCQLNKEEKVIFQKWKEKKLQIDPQAVVSEQQFLAERRAALKKSFGTPSSPMMMMPDHSLAIATTPDEAYSVRENFSNLKTDYSR